MKKFKIGKKIKNLKIFNIKIYIYLWAGTLKEIIKINELKVKVNMRHGVRSSLATTQ